MVEVRNFVREGLLRGKSQLQVSNTQFFHLWDHQLRPKIQDDMHDHDNDGYMFMALEGA